MQLYNARIIKLFTLLLFSEMFFMASCGGGGGDSFQDSNSQPLTIVIDFHDEEPVPTESRILESLRTLEDLDTCKIIISGGIPPIKEIVKEFNINETKSISVPIGENRMFTFIGQDQEGQPLCRGDVIIDVNPQSSTVTIGCEFVDETCTDGIDNDSDTLIDCEDPDCDRASCSPDDIDFECIDGECVIPEPSPIPTPGANPTPGPIINPGSTGSPSPTPTGTDNPTPTPTASPTPTPTSTGDCTGSGGGNCGVGGGGGGGNGTDDEGNNN